MNNTYKVLNNPESREWKQSPYNENSLVRAINLMNTDDSNDRLTFWETRINGSDRVPANRSFDFKQGDIVTGVQTRQSSNKRTIDYVNSNITLA